MSVVEDAIESIDRTAKGSAKIKKSPDLKHPGNLGHNEKAKPKDNRYRRERRFPI